MEYGMCGGYHADTPFRIPYSVSIFRVRIPYCASASSGTPCIP
jgi:hypothetical protein